MVAEHLHRRLRIGIERRLEAQLRDADLGEEGPDDALQIPQVQIVVGDEALDLVELAEVRRVLRGSMA